MRQEFEEAGVAVVRGLFGYDEIDRLCADFAALHASGPVPGRFEPRPPRGDGPAGPLHTHPRVMQPHEFSPLARAFLLHVRLRTVFEALLGEEALAAQSMF